MLWQVHSSVRQPSRKVAWIRPTPISHCEGSGNFYQVATRSQAWRWYVIMTDGPPNLFWHRRRTAPSNSSSYSTKFSTGKGYNATRMLHPGGGNSTLQHNYLFCHPRNDHKWWQGGGRGVSSALWYHPLIQIYSYFKRVWGSDVRMESTSATAVYTRRFLSVHRLDCTFRPISWRRRCSRLDHCWTSTCMSSSRHVNSEILALHWNYLGRGLGFACLRD